MKHLKTLEQLLLAYDNGERIFIDCDFDGSLEGVNLKGAVFQGCFFTCNFSYSNLMGARFEKCNLKTTSFRQANLNEAVITKCAVECVDFIGADINALKFYENYYMGNIMMQSDLEGFC